MQCFIDHAKDLEFNPEDYGEPLEYFEHGMM